MNFSFILNTSEKTQCNLTTIDTKTEGYKLLSLNDPNCDLIVARLYEIADEDEVNQLLALLEDHAVYYLSKKIEYYYEVHTFYTPEKSLPFMENGYPTAYATAVFTNFYRDFHPGREELALLESGELSYSIYSADDQNVPKNARPLLDLPESEIDRVKVACRKMQFSMYLYQIPKNIIKLMQLLLTTISDDPYLVIKILPFMLITMAVAQTRSTDESNKDSMDELVVNNWALSALKTENSITQSCAVPLQMINFDILKWPLLKMVRKDNLDIFKAVIHEGFDIYTKKPNGDFLIRDMVPGDCFNILRYMAKNLKADLNAFQSKKIQSSWLVNMMYLNNFNALESLVELGVDVNYSFEKGTILHYAVYSKKSLDQKLKYIDWLLALKADINALDSSGYTPVFRAAMHNQIEIMDHLIKKNCKTILADKTNLLSYVVRYSSLETVSFLLERGFDPNIHISTSVDELNELQIPTYAAIFRKDIKFMKLIFKHIRKKNMEYLAEPLLFEVLRINNMEVAYYLVQQEVISQKTINALLANLEPSDALVNDRASLLLQNVEKYDRYKEEFVIPEDVSILKSIEEIEFFLENENTIMSFLVFLSKSYLTLLSLIILGLRVVRSIDKYMNYKLIQNETNQKKWSLHVREKFEKFLNHIFDDIDPQAVDDILNCLPRNFHFKGKIVMEKEKFGIKSFTLCDEYVPEFTTDILRFCKEAYQQLITVSKINVDVVVRNNRSKMNKLIEKYLEKSHEYKAMQSHRNQNIHKEDINHIRGTNIIYDLEQIKLKLQDKIKANKIENQTNAVKKIYAKSYKEQTNLGSKLTNEISKLEKITKKLIEKSMHHDEFLITKNIKDYLDRHPSLSNYLFDKGASVDQLGQSPNDFSQIVGIMKSNNVETNNQIEEADETLKNIYRIFDEIDNRKSVEHEIKTESTKTKKDPKMKAPKKLGRAIQDTELKRSKPIESKKTIVENKGVKTVISFFPQDIPNKLKNDHRITYINELLLSMENILKSEDDSDVKKNATHYLLIKCADLIKDVAKSYKTILLMQQSCIAITNLRDNLVHYPECFFEKTNTKQLLKLFYDIFNTPFHDLKEKGVYTKIIDVSSMEDAFDFFFQDHKNNQELNEQKTLTTYLTSLEHVIAKAITMREIGIALEKDSKFIHNGILHYAMHSVLLQLREPLRFLRDNYNETVYQSFFRLSEIIKLGNKVAHQFSDENTQLTTIPGRNLYSDDIIPPFALLDIMKKIKQDQKIIQINIEYWNRNNSTSPTFKGR